MGPVILSDPNFTLNAAAQYGHTPQRWPDQYLAARDQAMVIAERQNEELAELAIVVLAQLRLPRPSMHRLDVPNLLRDLFWCEV